MDTDLDLNQTKIEIPTDAVFKQTELVDYFNSISYKITNQVGVPITTWHFNDASQAMKAVLKVQETGIPFRWIEEKIPALIIQYDDSEFFQPR